ncbi:hypothetical protein AWC38_SpisGene19567 [Stylophora pistillata]|uniref:Uncharacterized protein n=1 Tax=Stylophora pistillata TaxID=50429 RepID=A0A2B4RH72_STYPI|nr:hypothetical protein AWC38_SpisGene19567 [Stylophora pistillata]
MKTIIHSTQDEFYAVACGKGLDFLGKEYDDLSDSDASTKKELCRIGAKLDEIDVRLEEMAGILDEMQEYTYPFNVKLLGVPQLSADENAVQTSNLCVKDLQ